MKQILSYMRSAITKYDLISPGDRIAVGVSGGKDSLVLLAGLASLRRFLGIPFELVAITLDLRYDNKDTDFSAIEEYCRSIDVEYIIKRTEIGPIIFDIRKESNPCSLCARMRRGSLHDAAKEAGCNKIALGHHADDAIETFMMNLFSEGRIGCFSPKTYLSRKDITMIRPLIFAWEKDVSAACDRNNLPIVKSRCPADKHTNREVMKNFIAEREKEDPGFKVRIFGAIERSKIDGWKKENV